MQKELDKAVNEGVVTMDEGLEFIKNRKKYYDDYLKEQSKTTDGPIGLPEVEERTEFFKGALADTEEGKAMSPGTTATGGFRDGDKDGEDQVEVTSHPNTPNTCLLYTSPSPRDRQKSRMPSSA